MNKPDNEKDYGYVAYVDESGDDSIRSVMPVTKNSASEWLILSAVVISSKNEQKAEEWVELIKSRFKKNSNNILHFRNLNAARKLVACRTMAELPLRIFTVASNKKNMQGYSNLRASKIPSENWFYCWLTRVLLERVTHFVYNNSMKQNGSPSKVRA